MARKRGSGGIDDKLIRSKKAASPRPIEARYVSGSPFDVDSSLHRGRRWPGRSNSLANRETVCIKAVNDRAGVNLPRGSTPFYARLG
ncbi:hypothetical protein NL676_038037 [Syzygium grande]|nr:hypothetical protein NL676_038037 [Syzygium grande]